jgi:hypothetical protein
MTQQDQTVGVDDFFDNIGGTGAPTQKLQEINDGVIGTIESQRVVDYIPFGKKDPEILDDGKVRKQLVVILATAQRNWAGLVQAPFIDRDDKSKGTRPPEEDDGRRAVYIPQYKNIHYAVKDAVVASGAYGGKNGPLRDGGKFGVKVVDLEDTNQGNLKKVHKAFYEAPAAAPASADFLGDAPASTPPAAAAPPADPWASPAPAAAAPPAAAPAAAAPPATDPWGTPAPAPGTPDGPPF